MAPDLIAEEVENQRVVVDVAKNGSDFVGPAPAKISGRILFAGHRHARALPVMTAAPDGAQRDGAAGGAALPRFARHRAAAEDRLRLRLAAIGGGALVQ